MLRSIQVDKTVASITAAPDPMLQGKSRDANNKHAHYVVQQQSHALLCATTITRITLRFEMYAALY